MSAGELNVRLVLQIDATTPVGAGRSAGQSWNDPQDVATLSAHVTNRSGRNTEFESIAESTGLYDVTIRWRSDVTDKSRFAWRRANQPDRYLYVIHAPIAARSEFLTIQCQEGK